MNPEYKTGTKNAHARLANLTIKLHYLSRISKRKNVQCEVLYMMTGYLYIDESRFIMMTRCDKEY